MRIHTKATVMIVLVLALALATIAPVAAQEDEISPCEGESVSGTVVAVDEETGMVTIDAGDGLCTVTLDGGYDHPIVALLGSYFGDVSAENLAGALESTQGCAVHDPDSETWAWADCDVEDAVVVTVVTENEDGTFTTTATIDGEEVTVTVIVEDSATAGSLSEALQVLTVEWELNQHGAVVQPGDEIAAYHEDGLGFGVLVKLYAMAVESEEACADADGACGVTVEESVDAFQSGVGLGELFQEYGKPSILGVGHVRKGNGQPDHAGPKEKDNTGPPDHAGPKEKDNAGPPDHAGPKDDNGNVGPPDHAGPKDDKGNPGPPGHAGPKK